ncbi:hypothetical protein CCU01_004775 [Escherichia coli O145:NM]|uniref:Uncharacterized protein n=1 Tax=Escherichia coli O145:NM TaxID=991919 RepID=A0A4P8BY17_ECOLX|nr:hypothetical protein CCU01_004775 [Escherichia coli O145:NM]
MTDFRGKTSIFSHPVYLFLRKFSLQDSRGGSVRQTLAILSFGIKIFIYLYQILENFFSDQNVQIA